jgi:hypothetical protein
VTVGVLAATGNQHHRGAAGVPLFGTSVIPYEGYVDGFDSVDYLAKILVDPSSGLDFPAAIIVDGPGRSTSERSSGGTAQHSGAQQLLPDAADLSGTNPRRFELCISFPSLSKYY